MQLPNSMRDNMVDDLDEYLDAVSASPDTEAIAGYVIELLENYAENEGIDDIVAGLEEAASLEGTLSETLEEEMSSNDEFEYTGEEIISLVERLCEIEWLESEDDLDFSDEDDDDEDEDDEEDEED
ncbi:MAG: hypothetical protein R3F59_03430 [Myxococcota bacterium]